MQLSIKINKDKAIKLINRKIHGLINPRSFFVNFYSYMLSRTLLTFRSLGQGGTFRGVTWKPFADQYTRKSGVKIPAEGGTTKIRGKGIIKGRLRGGGHGEADRITSASKLLQHRGILMNAALNQMSLSRNKMVMDTNVNYADYQNAMRPFQFFEFPTDENVANRLFLRFVDGL